MAQAPIADPSGWTAGVDGVTMSPGQGGEEADVTFRLKADPWWDLEGSGVRRDRLRRRIVGGIAFVLAVGATGFSAAAWFKLLEPFVPRLLG